ncbi:helix-turn-helix transcriptional regulator [Anaerovoracaceae bacterium 41-7]|jgi:transcriptional regulator with XRE-family HTH domain|uniref:helix-turn-helix domain-containing protein n=1 Tax=Anaerovoracaceae TaxID=543314 RepID=UPI0013796E8B|nr:MULTISPECIES: helix-turn-helix transcriptional regulator [Clostridia]MCI9476004.1 helix-turn-helix transcriptional regulator [Emergencia sp.]MCI9640061.1 helix-turn-helix transcriptional regulator [Emergencia sp.]NCF00277.1 XRE family transcriptional regulator [Emergencia sp. 1XD21-10]
MSRLKQLRKNKDLTQLQVQLKTGIDQSNYSKMESGKRKPTSDQAELLSHLFETSVDYIYGFTDDPTPYPKPKKKD